MKRGPEAGGRRVDSYEKASAAWGYPLPDWVEMLARECDRTSQSRAAKRIGYSAETVSAVLGNTYRGELPRVEQAGRGALDAATVDCPEDGEISAHKCTANQRLPFSTANQWRIAIWRACRGGCPHSRVKGDDDGE